ncbi:MAG: SpoIID/LytB domain-containing protein [Actinomycetota bacterium]
MKRIALTLSFCVIAGMFAASGTPASAASSFTFFGAGRGHGIGMSQYGAYGLAQEGWTAERIVRHYYTGTQVQNRQPPANLFRIGLLQSRETTKVVAERGSYEILVDGQVIESVGEGQARTIKVTDDKRFRILRADGSAVGEPVGSPNQPLRIERVDGGPQPAIARVVEWGHGMARGEIELVIIGPGKANVVALVDPEEYLYGISEVPSSWPAAALEAQAIAARTYAYRKVANAANQSGCSCGLYGSTRDQAYTGWDKESSTDGDRWVAAVDATAQMVATYNGDFIYTFYSASSGGFTENIENVWAASSPQPYLKGVCDPGDFVNANPDRVWSEQMSGSDAAVGLGSPQGMAQVTRINVVERGVSGRVVKAEIVGTTASGERVSISETGWDLRGPFGLGDSRWWVNANRNVTGKIRQEYDGVMCAPGLATSNQRNVSGGAYQTFQEGRIYENDATGSAVWLRGAVLAKYLKLKGHTSFLGLPRKQLVVKKGKRVIFEGGEIYTKGATGTHELHGAVLAAFLEENGVKGPLGFPTTDVSKRRGTAHAEFEGGRIVCPRNGSCRIRT